MPRPGQIIPEYLHPHVETYINDNSVFQEVVSPAPDGVRLICVFTSGKGRDGVVLPMETTPQYLEEYGNPNYKLYGQPGYMPYAALTSNMAKVWCMRVMPDDAAYANAVVLAKVKVTGTDEKTLVIRHESVYHSGLLTRGDMDSLTEALTDEDPDADGFITIPLFGAYVLGRGAYGNAFRVRLSPSLLADKDNDYKNFRLEVLNSENGVKTVETFTGSFYPEALEGKNSLYLKDMVNDRETGSGKIGLYVNEAGIEAIYNLYKTSVNTETTITLVNFDPITGKDKTGAAISDIEIDTTTETAVPLDRPEGVLLSGGDDGAFTVGADLSARETAINNAYIKAFSGEYDRAILSKRRTPTELILDANYAEDVKRTLVGLFIKRYDAYGVIDAGILNSTTDAIAWAESFGSLGDKVFSKECLHYYIRDPFTGKNIPVTSTYFLAQQLPIHFRTVGNNVPFVGETYAKLTGFIKGSVRPVIDADDLEVKESLYNLRVNYFECISENVFVRGTQGTSQNVWSDLSEENNMHVTLELKRKLEAFVASKTYNFAEVEDRKRFTEDADRLISDYRGIKVRTATVEFKMSPWEEERSILHCYLALQFRTMAKRGLIEIDINKRV